MNVRPRSIILLLVMLATSACAQVGSVTGWGDTNWNQLSFPPGLTNIVAIAAGLLHSAALREDGTVIVWGDDSAGQISSQPPGVGGIRSIAAGDNHTVALRSNGTVVAWGYDFAATNVPSTVSGVRAIAAGDAYSLALKSNGTVIAWGSGQGLNVPGTLSGVRAISAGAAHALALKTNGTVVAWGANTWGQATVPAGLAGVRLITAGGEHSIALRSNGVYSVWGHNTYGQTTVSSAASNVVVLFSGANHSGAVRSDGKAICWGDDTFGQRTVPADVDHVITAASHANHNLAIYLQPPSITTQPFSQNVSAGVNVTFTVVAAGSPTLSYQWRKNGTNIVGAFSSTYQVNNAQGTNAGGYSVVITNPVGAVTSVVATLTVSTAPSITTQPQSQTVGLGTNVTLNVVATGTAPLHFQWKKNGTNISGANAATFQIPSTQPDDAATYSVVITNIYGNTTSSNAVLTIITPPSILQQPQSQTALAGASVTFTLAATNYTSIQWQHANTNIPGASAAMLTINRAKPSDGGTYVALLSNGHGNAATTPATLTVLTPSTPSDVVTWGQDPILVGVEFIDMAAPLGLVGVKAVTAGENHDLALRNDGSVVGWGDNSYGQGGLPPNVIATAIAAGANHTLAITNGRIGAWGLNTSGQATPPSITNVVALAAAANVSMALRGDGSVFLWGETTAGQAVLPPSVTNVVGIALGNEHCLALRANGTVVGWGGNTFGQARAPFSVTNVNAGIAAIASGAFHSLALKSNGTVVVWGRTDLGQTNVPPQATNIIAITAGAHHSLALRRDGAVIAWGYDNYGQSEPPSPLVATGIGAGAVRSLAIRRGSFVLLPPVRLSPTRLQIEVRNADGSLLSGAQTTALEVLVSDILTQPLASWTPITNKVSISTNGAAIFTDEPLNQPRRFYNVRAQ